MANFQKVNKLNVGHLWNVGERVNREVSTAVSAHPETDEPKLKESHLILEWAFLTRAKKKTKKKTFP